MVRVSPKATSSRRESVSHYESSTHPAASSSRNYPARVVVFGERGASADTSTASGTHVPSGAHALSRRIPDMAVEGLGMLMPEFKTKPCLGGTFTKHWAPEDQVLWQQWRERIHEVIKRRDLFPKDQRAETWNSDVRPRKERSARVRDCIMMGTGLPRGYRGRELGPGRAYQGRGEGFELPKQLAYLLASQVLVFFGGKSDKQMLECLYGLNHLKAAGYEEWR